MAKYMCMDTLRFLLFQVHHAEELFLHERYSEYTKDLSTIFLDSIKEWADQDFYPFYREMDEKPVYFKEGKVYSHPVLKKVFKQAGENGFLGNYFTYEEGGIQMPFTISNAANHILEAANNHIPGYLGLTSGAAHLITTFGNKDLIKQYVPQMLNGTWGGTMALTEPQAGSSLSDITTTAVPQADGTFLIKGQKIFISGGDHEATENFVHLTLARIEGAPTGTKGISLFVVPKYLENETGSTYNNVETAGDFQKLGQRGYSTVHLVFGEQGPTKGFLVGEPNKGLSYMFQMMNGARIDVGMTAASTATAAYYHSLQYAKERPQGRKINQTGKKEVSEQQTIIINHPDVKRMLYLQKAIVEGSLSLLLYCSKLQDLTLCETREKQQNALLLLELLTPIAKTYPAEMGKTSISNGLQILGGYGFCMDFPLQQYARDIRIMSIYEGTTGIQSLDLLGRKVVMENGKALHLLMDIFKNTIQKATQNEATKTYANVLSDHLMTVQKTLEHLLPFAMKGDYEHFLADATIFMEMVSHVVIAHEWLKIALTAKENLDQNPQLQYEFYQSKWQTMRFYFKYELPKTKALSETLLHKETLTIESEQEPFLL
ncbi:MAG: acyl-CoA dehydrogenase [Saprospiraceae bacterium]|nr:acyl-CoA dehydrogenase [Saprospiraceae bacterium]